MSIEEQVIEVPGPGREVNFPRVGRSEAIAVLKHAESIGAFETAYMSEGREIEVAEIIERLSSCDAEGILAGWTSDGLVSEFQLSFFWDEDTAISVALSFVPQDVDRGAYSLNAFLDWLKPFLVALDTDTYFVRYGSYPWEYGDTGETSGVIFTSSEYPING